MIIDRISRSAAYNSLVPEFEEGMRFALSLADRPVGRYEYEGLPEGRVYVLVSEGETGAFEEGRIEAHRKYLDVQIILKGGETVYYADIEGLEEEIPYSEEADVVFFRRCGQPARIEPGMFYVAFPHDGHLPTRYLDGPGTYRKLVLKIRVR